VARVSRSTLALAALASVAVPGLDPVAVRPADVTGMDFDVAVVQDAEGRRWVVRAPRRPAVAALVDAEARLLPRLQPLLPVPVPVPAGHCRLPEGGRCVVAAYLPGTPLDPAALRAGSPLAAEVGRVMAALHEIDPDVFEEAGAPVYGADEYRLRRLADVDRAAATGRVPASLLARWERALEQVSHWRFVPTPVHGDLAGEHVLEHEGRVSGVLDWGEARVADPADDLAWVAASAAPDALDTVLEAYSMARGDRPDPHLLDRARLAGELALARWLLGGVAADDARVVDDATRALGRLAEVVEAGGELGRSGADNGAGGEVAWESASEARDTGGEAAREARDTGPEADGVAAPPPHVGADRDVESHTGRTVGRPPDGDTNRDTGRSAASDVAPG